VISNYLAQKTCVYLSLYSGDSKLGMHFQLFKINLSANTFVSLKKK